MNLNYQQTIPALIMQGSAIEVLQTIPSETMQCGVCSPPYWGLRAYGTQPQIWTSDNELCDRHRWSKNNFCEQCGAWRGELGLEPSPALYVQPLVQIFREFRRVLRKDGILWLNLGDSYAGSGQSWGQQPETLSALQKSNKGSLQFLKMPPVNYRVSGLKPKDLVGIPWTVALALREDGWYLRSDVIWYKPNVMPESVDDRPTKAHEYIFLLTKSRRYYYNADAIREPHKKESIERTKHDWNGNRDAGAIKASYFGLQSSRMCHPKGRNKRSVWILSTSGFRGAHFATYPEGIPEVCIKAGSKIHDIVMDPFAGAGTTLAVAARLGRRPAGIELKQKYIRNFIIPRLQSEEIRNTMHKLFGYPGGKWPIRNLITSCFPKEYKIYGDIFGGSAAILLTKEISECEIFNDKNKEIVNFFRVVKHRPAELVERAKHWIHSRELWNEIKEMAVPVDELERAFRFWVLLADSFGGRGEYFAAQKSGVKSVTRARAYLDEVAARLADVHVECLPFDKVLDMYDAPDAFFYCDPPYRGTKGGNTNYDQLTDDEWRLLREKLGSIEGKFLLSSNNDRFVRKLFKGFHIKQIDVRVTLPKKSNAGFRKELLISNYPLPILRTKKHKVVYSNDRDPHRATGPRMVKEQTVKYNASVER